MQATVKTRLALGSHSNRPIDTIWSRNQGILRMNTVSQTITALVAALAFFATAAPIGYSQTAGTHLSANAIGTPTFYRDVLPILERHCQGCHRAGEVGPVPLETYQQVQPLAQAVADSVVQRRMPPWFADPRIGKFQNDPSLSGDEIHTLESWAKSMATAGDPGDAPPPRKWTSGWNIPTPDVVVQMPKPVPIPAEGDVEYTYEIVPTGFREGKWVSMSEIRPTSRENVHHAVVYIRPPDSGWLRHSPVGVPFTASDMTDEQDRHDTHTTKADILLVYAPGSSPDHWPAGMAKYIPAGSDLIFQMHYTTHGRATADQTKIGLVFAPEPPAPPAAEATPRRARGVVRKPERMPLRKLRERHERDSGRHPPSNRQAQAQREAARIASGARIERPWEARNGLSSAPPKIDGVALTICVRGSKLSSL